MFVIDFCLDLQELKRLSVREIYICLHQLTLTVSVNVINSCWCYSQLLFLNSKQNVTRRPGKGIDHKVHKNKGTKVLKKRLLSSKCKVEIVQIF